MLTKTLAALAALCVATAAPANGPLQVSSTVMIETKARAADGTTRVALAPATRVVPGDRVVFVVRYRNTGAQALSDVVVANPVPAGLTYRGPAEGIADPEVSVDGRTFAALGNLQLTDPAGGTRAAEADDVRYLRWRVARPMAAGAQGQFAYRAVLK